MSMNGSQHQHESEGDICWYQRVIFLTALQPTFAASLLNFVGPKKKGYMTLVLDHFSYSLYCNNHFLDKAHMQISLVL